jgi:hypothetical protein
MNKDKISLNLDHSASNGSKVNKMDEINKMDHKERVDDILGLVIAQSSQEKSFYCISFMLVVTWR